MSFNNYRQRPPRPGPSSLSSSSAMAARSNSSTLQKQPKPQAQAQAQPPAWLNGIEWSHEPAITAPQSDSEPQQDEPVLDTDTFIDEHTYKQFAWLPAYQPTPPTASLSEFIRRALPPVSLALPPTHAHDFNVLPPPPAAPAIPTGGAHHNHFQLQQAPPPANATGFTSLPSFATPITVPPQGPVPSTVSQAQVQHPPAFDPNHPVARLQQLLTNLGPSGLANPSASEAIGPLLTQLAASPMAAGINLASLLPAASSGAASVASDVARLLASASQPLEQAPTSSSSPASMGPPRAVERTKPEVVLVSDEESSQSGATSAAPSVPVSPTDPQHQLQLEPPKTASETAIAPSAAAPKPFHPYDIKNSDGMPYSILTLEQHKQFNQLEALIRTNPNSLDPTIHALYSQMSQIISIERAKLHAHLLPRLLTHLHSLPPLPPTMIHQVLEHTKTDLRRRSLWTHAYHWHTTWTIATPTATPSGGDSSPPLANLRYVAPFLAPKHLPALDLDLITPPGTPGVPIDRPEVGTYWRQASMPPLTTDSRMQNALFGGAARSGASGSPNAIVSAGTLAALAGVWAEISSRGVAGDDVMFPLSVYSGVVTLDKPMRPVPGVALDRTQVARKYMSAVARMVPVTKVGSDFADYAMWQLTRVDGQGGELRVLLRTRIDGVDHTRKTAVRIKPVLDHVPGLVAPLMSPKVAVKRFVQAVVRGDSSLDTSPTNAATVSPPPPPRLALVHIVPHTGQLTKIEYPLARDLVKHLPTPPQAVWGFIADVLGRLTAVPDGRYVLGFKVDAKDPFLLKANAAAGTGVGAGVQPNASIVFDMSSERNASPAVVYEGATVQRDPEGNEMPPHGVQVGVDVDWVVKDPVGGSDRISGTFPVMPPELRAQLVDVVPLPGSKLTAGPTPAVPAAATNKKAKKDGDAKKKKKKSNKKSKAVVPVDGVALHVAPDDDVVMDDVDGDAVSSFMAAAAVVSGSMQVGNGAASAGIGSESMGGD